MKTIPKTIFLFLIFIFCLLLNSRTSANLDNCPVPTVQGEVKWFFEWDPNNPDEMSPNTNVVLNVIGGKKEYTWSVTGNGFWFDAAYTITVIENTDAQSVTLYADSDACGGAVITVSDVRSAETSGSVRSSAGFWVEVSPSWECVAGRGPSNAEPGCRVQGKWKMCQDYRTGYAGPVNEGEGCGRCEVNCTHLPVCLECITVENCSKEFPCCDNFMVEEPWGEIQEYVTCLTLYGWREWEWQCS